VLHNKSATVTAVAAVAVETNEQELLFAPHDTQPQKVSVGAVFDGVIAAVIDGVPAFPAATVIPDTF